MKEKKHKDTQEMAGRTDNPSKKEKRNESTGKDSGAGLQRF